MVCVWGEEEWGNNEEGKGHESRQVKSEKKSEGRVRREVRNKEVREVRACMFSKKCYVLVACAAKASDVQGGVGVGKGRGIGGGEGILFLWDRSRGVAREVWAGKGGKKEEGERKRHYQDGRDEEVWKKGDGGKI